jgi:hypothetical protein
VAGAPGIGSELGTDGGVAIGAGVIIGIGVIMGIGVGAVCASASPQAPAVSAAAARAASMVCFIV